MVGDRENDALGVRWELGGEAVASGGAAMGQQQQPGSGGKEVRYAPLPSPPPLVPPQQPPPVPPPPQLPLQMQVRPYSR